MVKNLSIGEKAKKITDNYPIFEWAPGIPLDDDDDGNEYTVIVQPNDHNDDIEQQEIELIEDNDVDNADHVIPENLDDIMYITEDEQESETKDNKEINNKEDDESIMNEDHDGPRTYLSKERTLSK